MPTHFNGRFDDEAGCCKIRDLQGELKDDPQFLTKVVTGDKIWCYGYNPESEQQPSQRKSPNLPRPKVVQQVRSSFKITLISLFDVDGIVHREFVSPEQTEKQEFYLNVLKTVQEPAMKSSREVSEWRLVLPP
jgi:hypothetical protein